MTVPKIQKKLTWFMETISSRIKPEITLRYSASYEGLEPRQQLYSSKRHNIFFFVTDVVGPSMVVFFENTLIWVVQIIPSRSIPL
jgi:hypothetical protein